MHFTKMHGLGNDYLYVYGEVPGNVKELTVRLSDRHFGAGSDGMIYISPSDRADFRMRIFNADGSEAKMCGNGIRCVGKYVYEKGYTKKTELEIETLSGIRKLMLHLGDAASTGNRNGNITADRQCPADSDLPADADNKAGSVISVSVDMGTAETSDEMWIEAGERTWKLLPVSVGNPHAVIFVEDADTVRLSEIGPLIERHEAFPGGVNVEFVQVLQENRLRMRVWERGSGITLACGTGACASAAAACLKGYCVYGQPVELLLDGGSLEITVFADGRVLMTGPAERVYEADAVL